MTTGLGVWDYGKDFASMLSMAFLVRAMALLREIGPDISINGWQITKKKKALTIKVTQHNLLPVRVSWQGLRVSSFLL